MEFPAEQIQGFLRRSGLGSLPNSGLPPVPCRVLLATANPEEFIGLFLEHLVRGDALHLADPAWPEGRWRLAAEWAGPLTPSGSQALAWLGKPDRPVVAEGAETAQIAIPTGGTSGGLRWARHTSGTLAAAAAGFQRFFGADTVDSYCCLPLHHVGGLMQLVRSLATGGRLELFAWRELPEVILRRPPDQARAFLSLVPLQLVRLLENPEALAALQASRFRAVLVGGGSLDPAIAERALETGIPMVVSYGLTETAALAAATPPGESLAATGMPLAGIPLPHLQIEVTGESGVRCKPGDSGRIRIRGASLFKGYIGETNEGGPDPLTGWWNSSDAGYLDAEGRLVVTGRLDRRIKCGGESIDLAAIEEAFAQVPGVSEVCACGLPDPEWGERLALALVLPRPAAELDGRQALSGEVRAGIEAILKELAPWQRPRQWALLAEMPRNAMGKADLSRVEWRAKLSG